MCRYIVSFVDGYVISVAVKICVMFIIKSFLGILTSMCAFLLESHLYALSLLQDDDHFSRFCHFFVLAVKFARFVVEKCGKDADNFNEILRCYLANHNLGVGEKKACNVTGVLFYFANSNPLLTMKDLYDVVMMSCPRQQEQIVDLIRYVEMCGV